MPLPNLDDVPSLHLAEDGAHEVEITYATEFTSQNNRECLRGAMRVLDDEDADDIPFIVFYPADHDSPRDYKKSAAKIRKFQECFGLKPGTDAKDMVGAVGNVITRQKTNQETGEREVNIVRYE